MSTLRFPDIRRRVRQGRRLALARACDARPGLRVHDALAGWGTDGLVLAALGCRVHFSEQHPDVYEILDSRLQAESKQTSGAPSPTRVGDNTASELDSSGSPLPRSRGPGRPARLLTEPDSISWAHEDARDRWRDGGTFDVVYLDPMFGEHPKTAMPAKQMQVLAGLVGEMAKGEIVELIDEARRIASARVVVKRRASAEALGRPDWQIRGRSVRFDVYRPALPRSSA